MALRGGAGWLAVGGRTRRKRSGSAKREAAAPIMRALSVGDGLSTGMVGRCS